MMQKKARQYRQGQVMTVAIRVLARQMTKYHITAYVRLGHTRPNSVHMRQKRWIFHRLERTHFRDFDRRAKSLNYCFPRKRGTLRGRGSYKNRRFVGSDPCALPAGAKQS